MLKKVVVASDSFKGSLTSAQVADGVEAGILACFPCCEVVKLSVADGGEGTVDALVGAMGGRRVCIEVSDPLGRPCNAVYAILDDGLTAVMEMSSASGLTLLSPEERNPMLTSTYGTGMMIADALDRGCRRFMIGIGGSATNDAGTGMLEALGYRFYDKDGNLLKGCGEALARVARIDMSGVRKDLSEAEFKVACDVGSPFFGLDGAAYMYAPQKGATPEMTAQLDRGLRNFAGLIAETFGTDISGLRGAGAAGGLGGAFSVFLSAVLSRGADLVLDAIGFDEIIRDADLVVTGEGRIDVQTAAGKLPYAVAQRAGNKGVPVVAVCGTMQFPTHPLFSHICPVTPADMPVHEAMKPSVATSNLIRAVRSLMQDYISAV